MLPAPASLLARCCWALPGGLACAGASSPWPAQQAATAAVWQLHQHRGQQQQHQPAAYSTKHTPRQKRAERVAIAATTQAAALAVRRPARSRNAAPAQAAKGYSNRLPHIRKYGAALREVDPAAFERMRLLLGYYDLPANRHKPRPPPPSSCTLNQLQTLWFTDDVDPFYKLSLLSYRSKLQNAQVAQGLAKARAFAQRLAAPQPVPAELAAAVAAADAAAAAASKASQQQDQQPASRP